MRNVKRIAEQRKQVEQAKRANEIRDLCKLARKPERAESFIEGGWTSEQVRECLAQEAMETTQADDGSRIDFSAIYPHYKCFGERTDEI